MGSTEFNDPTKYEGCFNTGSISLGPVKGSFAIDPKNTVTTVGLGGTSPSLDISIGRTYYWRVDRELLKQIEGCELLFLKFIEVYLKGGLNQWQQ